MALSPRESGQTVSVLKVAWVHKYIIPFFIALVTDGVLGQEANARLIAAAPTLLEILALFVDCYPDQIEPLQDRARYIIAKVQGGTND